MTNALMKFDPATGQGRPYPSQADQWRAWHGCPAWLFNPWSGKRRNALDVGADPFGLLCLPPTEPLHSTRTSGMTEAEADAFVKEQWAEADKYLADEWSHYDITDDTRAMVRSAWTELARRQSA